MLERSTATEEENKVNEPEISDAICTEDEIKDLLLRLTTSDTIEEENAANPSTLSNCT
jgi:hypothetical protein